MEDLQFVTTGLKGAKTQHTATLKCGMEFWHDEVALLCRRGGYTPLSRTLQVCPTTSSEERICWLATVCGCPG